MSNRPTVAVIGSGVSGLTAGYLLQRVYDVTLYEADGRLGGHAHTHDLPTPDGRTAHVDSGFIVHNERTYPNLLRLFRELEVSTQDSEMSMSVRCDGCGLEFAGARKLPGLFPTPGNLTNTRYLRMLREITRFHKQAKALIAQPDDPSLTLGRFLEQGGYTRYFVDHFMIPVVSCVWSAGTELSTQYPARYLFEFLNNHGMLSVGDSPQWRTVVGGSNEYVRKAAARLSTVVTSTPVREVRRGPDSVAVRGADDVVTEFDKVVIATHPDQALDMLGDATPTEKDVLGAFQYSRNETWLHTDPSVLPRTRFAKASWNYLKRSCSDAEDSVLVSYHMNRLMRLVEPQDYVVTLNATDRLDESRVLAKMVYEHPIYTPESVAAQRRLPELSTGRIAFAGAYHGWGFHEDGCASGVNAATALGAGWPS
ncbi:amine oxidase [Pseudonocardiaceae bacterium YIM PH 21723]|nr:amine oxidase [Pseudonocardiaceae bacterium YIM PH 21723]